MSQRNYPNRGQNEPTPQLEFNNSWISNGIKKEAIDYAESLGRILAKRNFSTSQIRNFYGELKRIQLKGIDQSQQKVSFHLLRPKLAYAAKRKGDVATIFKDEIFKAHAAVDIDSDGYKMRFQNFCDLCEAILAFHKASGGN